MMSITIATAQTRRLPAHSSRGPMGAGQPIPQNVSPHTHTHNPLRPVVVNPLRPVQEHRVTHNPMRPSGGLLRSGYVLPDVSEDVEEGDNV